MVADLCKAQFVGSNDDSLETSPCAFAQDLLECDMKRLLLGVAISAFATPSWAQVQADYSNPNSKDETCYLETADYAVKMLSE